MSTGNTPVGFGIYDLLTRVTPGAVFLLIFIIPIAVTTSLFQGQLTSIELIAFAVLSFVLGEGINHIAGWLFLPPTAFRRFLHEQGVDVERGWLDRLRSKIPYAPEGKSYVFTVAGDDFWELFTSHFRLNDDYSNVWDIYNHLLSYMEPKLSPRTRRQQTVYHFVNNTVLAILFGGTWATLVVVQGILTGNVPDITIAWTAIILILLVSILYMMTMVFGSQESQYVSNLVIEYYIDRTESGDVDELTSESIQATLDGDSSRGQPTAQDDGKSIEK